MKKYLILHTLLISGIILSSENQNLKGIDFDAKREVLCFLWNGKTLTNEDYIAENNETPLEEKTGMIHAWMNECNSEGIFEERSYNAAAWLYQNNLTQLSKNRN